MPTTASPVARILNLVKLERKEITAITSPPRVTPSRTICEE